jgi:hypothetical protein
MVTQGRLREVKQQLDQLVERGWLVTWRWYDQDLVRCDPARSKGTRYAADHPAYAIVAGDCRASISRGRYP